MTDSDETVSTLTAVCVILLGLAAVSVVPCVYSVKIKEGASIVTFLTHQPSQAPMNTFLAVQRKEQDRMIT